MTESQIDMLTPVLTKNWGDDRAWTLAAYEDQGGYEGLTQALDDGSRRPRRAGQGRPACAVAAVPASPPA